MAIGKPAQEHNHAEAFALMNYRCKCGHQEKAWNSRDGVTAFTVTCPSCGEVSLTHENWSADTFAPNHKPYIGQLVWRDGTVEDASNILDQRIKLILAQTGDEDSIASKYAPFKTEAEAVNWKREQTALIEAGNHPEFRKGWPMLARYGFTRNYGVI